MWSEKMMASFSEVCNNLRNHLVSSGWASYGTGWVEEDLFKPEQSSMFLEGAAMRILLEKEVWLVIGKKRRATLKITLDSIEECGDTESVPQNQTKLCREVAEYVQETARTALKNNTQT